MVANLWHLQESNYTLKGPGAPMLGLEKSSVKNAAKQACMSEQMLHLKKNSRRKSGILLEIEPKTF